VSPSLKLLKLCVSPSLKLWERPSSFGRSWNVWEPVHDFLFGTHCVAECSSEKFRMNTPVQPSQESTMGRKNGVYIILHDFFFRPLYNHTGRV
ncbi:MAG: hypothetical protein ACLFQB_11935, partial [Chitinispirillaceae bacterium]